MFRSTESAFKYQILVMIVLYSLRIILHLIDVTLVSWMFSIKHHHFDQIEHFSLVVSPFDCLGELIKQALDHGVGKYKGKAPVTTIYIFCLLQALFYFNVTVLFDSIYCNSFKGKSRIGKIKERTTL